MAGWFYLVAIVDELLENLRSPLQTLPQKADMKCARITDLARFALHERQHETVFPVHTDELGVIRGAFHAFKAEVFFHIPTGSLCIRDGEVDVVDFHGLRLH